MKLTFNLYNFFKQNTPKAIENLGNIFLVLAGLGTTLLAMPQIADLGTLTPLVHKTAILSLVIGTIGKAICKMFGKKPDDTIIESNRNSL